MPTTLAYRDERVAVPAWKRHCGKHLAPDYGGGTPTDERWQKVETTIATTPP
jgi:hypothetical protein